MYSYGADGLPLRSAICTALFVVENNKPVGIVHIHDLLRLGL